MLYANGYFVRELTPEETSELAEYEVAIGEYSKASASFEHVLNSKNFFK